MKELEKTYLLKYIPEWLSSAPYKDLLDIYIPFDSKHPHLRIRKYDQKLMIMKKELIDPDDLSAQEESIIDLTPEEFCVLSQVPGKRIHKQRYTFPYQGLDVEIDIFQEALSWLILVDVEFADEESKNAFTLPDFCLCEVTQELMFAWGMLCGKSYSDISEKLSQLGYTKLYID